MTDLWPDIKTTANLKAPVNILREQAALLGNKTQNIVKAKVRSVSSDFLKEKKLIKQGDDMVHMTIVEDPSGFHYNFFLVSPMLDNYEYAIFSISYSIELYPVRIRPDIDILKEITQSDRSQWILADSEAEFLEVLGKIFRAEKTKKIINALLVQSTSPVDA